MAFKCALVLWLTLPGVAVNAPWGPTPAGVDADLLRAARARLAQWRKLLDRVPADRPAPSSWKQGEDFARRDVTRVIQPTRPPWQFHMPVGPPPKAKVRD